MQRLERLKRKYKVPSYNSVIEKLVDKEEKPPKDLFGAFPNLGKFEREKEDEYRDY